MNVNRKKTFVNLEGKRYAMILDFESAIYFQELTDKSIFEGIEEISKNKNLASLAYLVGATLRDKDDNIVGIEKVKKMNLLTNLEPLMGAMASLMENSIEKEEKAKAVKKK